MRFHGSNARSKNKICLTGKYIHDIANFYSRLKDPGIMAVIYKQKFLPLPAHFVDDQRTRN